MRRFRPAGRWRRHRPSICFGRIGSRRSSRLRPAVRGTRRDRQQTGAAPLRPSQDHMFGLLGMDIRPGKGDDFLDERDGRFIIELELSPRLEEPFLLEPTLFSTRSLLAIPSSAPLCIGCNDCGKQSWKRRTFGRWICHRRLVCD